MQLFSTSQVQLLKLAKEDFNRYSLLPIAVYITDKETGTFLEFNNAAKILFGLSESDKGKKEITSFYRHKSDRKHVMRCLEKTLIESLTTKTEHWESNSTLEFLIKENKISLKFYAKPFGNNKDELLGSLSLAFPIPEINKFYKLEDKMTNGIFEIGIDQSLTHSNKSFNELLQIPNYNFKSKYFAKQFFSTERDYTRLLESLKPKVTFESGPVVLKSIGGNKRLANLIVVPEFSSEGKLIKSRGIVRDLAHHEILDKAPIGICLIMEKNGHDVIMNANKEWLKIHEFKNEFSCIGFRIEKLHVNKESYEKYLKKIEEVNNNGRSLEKYPLEVKTLKGNLRQLKVTEINYQNQITGEIIGRIGIVMDVTNEVDDALDSWKKDYAGFLHSYSNMLISMRDTINSVISGHSTDVFINRRVDVKAAFKIMEAYILKLPENWKILLEEIRAKDIPFSEIKIQKALLNLNKKENEGIKEKAAWIRQILKIIRTELNNQLKNHKLHKETLKSFLNDISEILRYARLISLSLIVDDIPELLKDIDTFKSILMDGEKTAIRFLPVNINEVLSDAIKSLDEFAQSKGVLIKKHFNDERSLLIDGVYRDLYSAFYNIIHNSIKYSRTDDQFGKLTVNLFIDEAQEGFDIVIINLGIPIRISELSEKLIFKFGFRGADSMKDGRKGSGIGLWHAKKIIENHHGKIFITSQPTSYNAPDDYTKWFKTTVKISLKTKHNARTIN